jgi:hypothetical protein
VELVVPFELWAKAADTIPQTKPAAITPTPICFFNTSGLLFCE